MKRFKNILVIVTSEYTDKDNPAVKRGVELAKKNNGTLTLMDVVAAPGGVMSEYKGIITEQEILQMVIKQREEELAIIAKALETEVKIQVVVRVGRDFVEIVRQVVLWKHDLLIKVADEHTDNFASNDFHLMRKCPQPVWLLKSKEVSASSKILAAVDLQLESDDEGRALNTLIMDLSVSLSQWEHSEVHLLSCWSLYGESSLRNSSFLKVSSDRLETLLHEEEQANVQRQSALLERYPNCTIHAHLMKGNPVEHIPRFARRNGIDVVVMGTVARSGIPGLLIGNTAETILHQIDSSVITLKPRGFESPIK